VDLDLEQFFDRGESRPVDEPGQEASIDRRILKLIDRYLKRGAHQRRLEATPEGRRRRPISPLLANLLLDGLDKELESRGHRFVRLCG